MHTTVRSGSRRWRISSDVTSERFHGSSSVRSITSTIGQPARSRSMRRPRQRAPLERRQRRAGETSNTGAPARRAPLDRPRRGRARSAIPPPAAPRRARRDHDRRSEVRARRPRRRPRRRSRRRHRRPPPAHSFGHHARRSGRCVAAGPPSSIARSTDGTTTTSVGPIADRARAPPASGRSPAAAGAHRHRPRGSPSTRAIAARRPTPVRRLAGRPTTAARRRRRDQEVSPPGGPPDRRPVGEFDQIGGRPVPGDLGDRLEHGRVDAHPRDRSRRPTRRPVDRAGRRARSSRSRRRRRDRRERGSRTCLSRPGDVRQHPGDGHRPPTLGNRTGVDAHRAPIRRRAPT